MNTMIKLSGSGLLIFAAFLLGRKKANAENHAIIVFGEFISFIKFIRDNIAHMKTPIPDICREYQTDSVEIQKFLTDAETYGIREAFEKNYAILPQKSRKTAEKFASEIGRGYGVETLELCRYTIDVLDGQYKTMKDDMVQRRRMWYSLPPLFASSVILIFI